MASDVADNSASGVRAHPTFAEAFRFWLKLGFISFGGPTGQIAIMHTELVDRRRWISEARFLHALNYCMLLPGPEAQQLATYIGWLLHGTRGGIVAGSLFVAPSAVILWLLSYVYVVYGQLPWVAAVLDGLKPAVVAIVAAAVIRIGRRALRNRALWAVAGAAFVAIFFLKAPFPVIVLGAGLVGLVASTFTPRWFSASPGHHGKASADAVPGDSDTSTGRVGPTLFRAIRVVAVWGALWWSPILVLFPWLGAEHTLFREGVFFSKAAMVTFGGAYAVLPYVAQQAVERFAWLTTGQMLDGLGLAETTPGPLIMVVQFVGFVGAWNHPGSLPPLSAATLGAAISTWVTFMPCFLWVFLGAPYIERLRANQRLTAALSAVTAAVVGVILNLAVRFGLHVMVPASGGVPWFALVLAVAVFVALVRYRIGIVTVVGLAALLGLVHHAVRTL